MFKRSVLVLALAVLTLGAFALLAPTPQTLADPNCIICPQIAINCGTCGTLVPQTCHQCAHCKQIPGCHS